MNKETFEEWYKKNYKGEYITDGNWINHQLSEVEICGSQPTIAASREIKEILEKACKVTWNHQQAKLDQKDERIKELEGENKEYLATMDNYYELCDKKDARIKELEEVGVKWMDKSVALDKQLDEANEVISFVAGSEIACCDLNASKIIEKDTCDIFQEKAKEYQAKYKGE